MKKILCMIILTIFILSCTITAIACGSDTEEVTPPPIPEPEPALPEPTVPPSEPQTTPEPQPSSDGYIVEITETGFSPETITVPVGAKVIWYNRDPLRRHWVTSKTKKPDTRVIPVEARMGFTFDEPGVYEYYCVYHREETGKVIVE